MTRFQLLRSNDLQGGLDNGRGYCRQLQGLVILFRTSSMIHVLLLCHSSNKRHQKNRLKWSCSLRTETGSVQRENSHATHNVLAETKPSIGH
mmetsp:Transcript_18177/g.41879  ORF Transcript_18177/g.41879 Transcript_18177/m.41879 type:complete len:92 (-) Transcript_18177:346-621(-)